MPILLGVTIAGAAGAAVRYQIDGFISARGGIFPWGTFVINISGAFLLGLLFTVFSERLNVEPWVRSSVTTGFLGAYTTFSTLTLETSRLIEQGSYVAALANSLGSLACGMVAVFGGIALGRLI
ncbi:MAG: fluoride efflux transporter CrcB [Candidatus Dormibacteria bacterium]